MSQPPDDHIKALWQGQETETPAMTAQAIRMLVSDYQAGSRQKVLIALGICVFVAVFFGWCAWVAPNRLVRIGDLVMLAWVPCWALILWSRRPPAAPGGEASTAGLIDFHRAQVARQAPDLRLIAAMMLPVFTGMAVIAAGTWEHARRMHFLPLLPPSILLAIWMVVFVLQLRRQSRRVRDRLREIDALRG